MGNVPAVAWNEAGKIRRIANILAWIGILSLAIGFVFKYVFHYYLHYNAAAFGQGMSTTLVNR